MYKINYNGRTSYVSKYFYCCIMYSTGRTVT